MRPTTDDTATDITDTHPPEAAVADLAPPAENSTARDPEGDEHFRDSVAAQQLFDQAVDEAARGNENEAVIHFMRATKLAEAAREWYLAAAACHRIGDAYQNPGDPYDLARAIRMYHRAIAAYHQCGLFGEARALEYQIGRLRLWRAGELGLPARERIELFAYWALTGFGVRPLRVLAAAACAILTFAALYWIVGGIVTPDGRPIEGFATALYFSGITFATVGYGEFVPAPHARFLAMAEGMLGFVTVSCFVVVLANRMRK